jgi:hypothetical protein
VKLQKLILILVATSLAACGLCIGAQVLGNLALGAWVFGGFSSDPQRVATVGAAIGVFDVPPGYAQLSHHLLNDVTIILSPPKGSLKPEISLRIYSLRKGATVEDAEALLPFARRDMQSKGYRTTSEDFALDTIRIRGEEVPLAIIEGYQGDRAVFRCLSAYFTAKDGRRASLDIEGPIAGWDQPLVDRFIASMR